MVSEVVKTLRFLTRPFRREFWYGRKAGREHNDHPGVLLISLSGLTDRQAQKVARDWTHHKPHPTLDSQLPPLHTWEHESGEKESVALYRFFVFCWRTILLFPLLWKKKVSWSTHLSEADELARTYAALANGKDFFHLCGLHHEIRGSLRRLKRFVRGLERRRYSIWLLLRDQRQCLLPAELQLPEEPLGCSELVLMASAYTVFENRVAAPQGASKEPGTLRVMTYNLHSCVGLDGRMSIQRIAEVLHRYQPDFVALQEIDRNCKRTGGIDQLSALRKLWASTGAFFPLLKKSGGQYGIGFLTTLEVLEWDGRMLPQVPQLTPQEARGVVRVKVRYEEQELVFYNTHLGLTRKERRSQMAGLLQEVQTQQSPHVLLGDFNCSPKSREYTDLCCHLHSAQQQPSKTWFGTFPLRHLDYIFHSTGWEVIRTFAPRDSLTRIASDHLPLITDLKPPSSDR